MDSNSIKEYNKIQIGSDIFDIPNDIWINDSLNSLEIKIIDDIDEIYFSFKEEIEKFKVCNVNDWNNFLNLLNIDITDCDLFRVFIKETTKWGLKPMFVNGINSICFEIIIVKMNNFVYFLLFSKSGSKEIESIYFHGIWRVRDGHPI
jgi:hypothetical protein